MILAKSIKRNVNTYFSLWDLLDKNQALKGCTRHSFAHNRHFQSCHLEYCSGAYTVSANTISFENECGFLANFDHTLILSDSWSYSYNNNVLILTKANGDEYTLTLQ